MNFFTPYLGDGNQILYHKFSFGKLWTESVGGGRGEEYFFFFMFLINFFHSVSFFTPHLIKHISLVLSRFLSLFDRSFPFPLLFIASTTLRNLFSLIFLGVGVLICFPLKFLSLFLACLACLAAENFVFIVAYMLYLSHNATSYHFNITQMLDSLHHPSEIIFSLLPESFNTFYLSSVFELINFLLHINFILFLQAFSNELSLLHKLRYSVTLFLFCARHFSSLKSLNFPSRIYWDFCMGFSLKLFFSATVQTYW